MTDIDLLVNALDTARRAHEGQWRRGEPREPYIAHVIRVALGATLAGMPPEAVAAAFLHDVMEDSDLTTQILEGEFPLRTVQLIDLLSKDWPSGSPSYIEEDRAPLYYARLGQDPEAVDLKLLDNTDNCHSALKLLKGPSPVEHRRWAARYATKSRRWVLPLTLKARPSSAEYVVEPYLNTLRDLEVAVAVTGL